MAPPYVRIGRRRWAGAVATASVLLLGLCWIDWWYGGSAWFGVPYPWFVTAALLINIALTARWPTLKRTIVAGFQRWMLNPLVRLLQQVGLTLGWSLVETTGRRTGQRRVVPVGNGLVGSQFWIVAEHGLRAGYVRNLASNPHVRVRLRDGWRLRWRTGIAHVLADDDPYARQRWLIGRRHPLRAQRNDRPRPRNRAGHDPHRPGRENCQPGELSSISAATACPADFAPEAAQA